MPHRLEVILDITQVFIAYTLAFIISLNNISDWFKCLSFIAATGYTTWKWLKEYNEAKKKKKK